MLSRRKPSHGRGRESGQGLVEFAVVAPILLVIMLAIIQFGWIFTSQIGLTNSIREAARFAATNPTVAATEVFNGNATVAQLDAILPRNVNFYAVGNLSSRTATYCEYPDPKPGNFSVRVRVVVQYRHPLFIPIIGPLLDGMDSVSDNALLVGAVEEMRVENTPPLTGSPGMTSC